MIRISADIGCTSFSIFSFPHLLLLFTYIIRQGVLNVDWDFFAGIKMVLRWNRGRKMVFGCIFADILIYFVNYIIKISSEYAPKQIRKL